MSLQIVYFTCFVVGFVYAVFVSVIGHLGTDVDGGGHDVGGVGHGSDLTHFSPISPVIIGSFVSVFGAAGFIAAKFHMESTASLGVAVVTALVVDGGIFLAMKKMYSVTQASSEAVVGELVGKEAEVITPIPESGFGEIAYLSKGSRYTAPAKSIGNVAIAKHEVVRIGKIVGSTYFVERPAPPKEGA